MTLGNRSTLFRFRNNVERRPPGSEGGCAEKAQSEQDTNGTSPRSPPCTDRPTLHRWRLIKPRPHLGPQPRPDCPGHITRTQTDHLWPIPKPVAAQPPPPTPDGHLELLPVGGAEVQLTTPPPGPVYVTPVPSMYRNTSGHALDSMMTGVSDLVIPGFYFYLPAAVAFVGRLPDWGLGGLCIRGPQR